jgi:hypothetical protein
MVKAFPRLGLLFAVIFLAAAAAQAQTEKISSPGQYAGYSQPLYTEWVRASQYVAVRDGTQLALDIFRPAQAGQPVAQPMPVVWSHNRYHRAEVSNGKLKTILDSEPWLKTLLKYGYSVAIADVRGGGASFGVRADKYTRQDAQDAYDLTEWLAVQPWCTGQVGMFGASFMGATQLMVASLAPPHLRAIVPQVAPFNIYADDYPGGVFADGAVAEWSRTVQELDTSLLIAPVDQDPGGALLAQALAAHQANPDFYALAKSLPYRDSVSKGEQVWLTLGASNYLPQISQTGIAIYHIAGWYDPYRLGALLAFRNLTNPQKVLIGPWTHSRVGEYFDLGLEHVRWYDYWLKGIDNGILAEPPIYYHTVGVPEKQAWQFADQWPVPAPQTAFYFHAGPTHSAKSVNDGRLDATPPTEFTGQDNYTVDYATSSSADAEWNDAHGLTYTTPPLPQAVKMTGHPIVYLWVNSTAADGDFFVSLYEVAENGVSTYLTDGVLRASHRALTDPPFEMLGLPYHRSFAQDMAPLPAGEPVELVFDLLPISNLFDAGHRLRLTLTNADKGNMLTPVLSPPPMVSIYRNAQHASHIVLPLAPIEWPVNSAQESPVTIELIVGVLAALAGLALLGVAFKRTPWSTRK